MVGKCWREWTKPVDGCEIHSSSRWFIPSKFHSLHLFHSQDLATAGFRNHPPYLGLSDLTKLHETTPRYVGWSKIWKSSRLRVKLWNGSNKTSTVLVVCICIDSYATLCCFWPNPWLTISADRSSHGAGPRSTAGSATGQKEAPLQGKQLDGQLDGQTLKTWKLMWSKM